MVTGGTAERLAGLALGSLVCLPMALRAAINLKVFEIIAKGGAGARLSPAEIVAKIPTTNPGAAALLERILRVLAANALLTVFYTPAAAAGEKVEALYGIGEWATSLVPGGDGASAAAEFLLCSEKATVESFYHLEEAVREEGCMPFERAHGMSLFEFTEKEEGYTGVFQEAMSNISTMVLKEVFKVYSGFEEVKEMVDAGGGRGTCLALIVRKYPHIRALDFDLPFVVASAPPHPGVVHVGGNMFEGVPRAKTIFMKCILHDWSDEKCLEILRNCWTALPDQGKIINLEFVVPEKLGTDIVSLHMAAQDLFMMSCCPKGKERTLEELSALGKAGGFVEMKHFPVALGLHVLEFHKQV